MVSAIPYRSFKELDLRHSYGTLVFVVFAIALIVQEPSVTLFVIGIALRGLGSGRVDLPPAREAPAPADRGARPRARPSRGEA